MSDILEKDVEFAREVVAVCRKYGMNNLRLTFNHNFNVATTMGNFSRKEVTWNEGRHGDSAQITFKLESSMSFPEQE